MLAVYRMYRILYAANPGNQAGLFHVDPRLAAGYTTAAMHRCEANAEACTQGLRSESVEPLEDAGAFANHDRESHRTLSPLRLLTVKPHPERRKPHPQRPVGAGRGVRFYCNTISPR